MSLGLDEQVDAPGAPARPGGGTVTAAPRSVAQRALLVGVFVAGAVLVAVLALVDLTLGTSDVGVADLLRLLTGSGDDEALAVLVASRAPRVLAGLLVGAALGVSGGVLQSVARNPLASPDTLAVNAGAYVTVVVASVLGLSLPFALNGALTFLGGLAAASFVLAISRGGASGPSRLVLAGSATMLALSSVTYLLMILFEEETQGMFAWGEGTIVQSGSQKVAQAAPVVLVAIVVAVVWARRLDLLALGDDTASVLGLDVRRTRLVAVLLAVLLAALAVSVAGPVGFVGLSAPVIARLVASRVPGLHRHRLLLPFAALAGCAVVLAADVLIRLAVPARTGVMVPTGVVTTLLGAALMVWLARRLRASGPVRVTASVGARTASHARVATVLGVLTALVVALLVAGLLLGDRLLLTGDVLNWLSGVSGRQVTFVLDQRVPRVLAALLAGAALGLAGTSVQAVARNPLAEPGLLGITGGAGVGAVVATALVPGASVWTVSVGAVLGAVLTFSLVYGLSSRRGLSSDRLVLVGIGVSAAATSVITLLVVLTSPWNTTMALTFLSGSTYGRTAAQVWPVGIALVVLVPLLLRWRRDLDVLALDDDVPRVLGVALERTRFGLLVVTALLTASAVSAVGVVGFVGLVAPHLARALVGSSHARVVPVAALLGAVVLSLADTVGRTVIAPAQIPAGLVTALIGAPYFVWLLWRTRRSA
ncbi:iron ABC transporter permease [Cellulomonas fimi]|uniref:Transport system permease protein n=1 Tax=Cellulomonas fimi (strain ATCC 484 / DSM 20113 / JCM 1341 / CCUG 24087 / LMG 16345 / NBRC 15513 / NCIMB 8980 / NCTC 7547 / NRS-133) TaxID=590998 RepID=F4H4I0_CELFA|nr:iron ABC transporter permease [Cellulomonas fimi]AEE47775.1 transport system permease protein [Cellulomonas fimi ATCC 484]NNH06688.1 iron ABC transporter permease [Cellulomonas fimi]VEH36976.1 Iron(III)-hydroxamate import system permease protein fhuB [Cellulomonas fimi]